MPNAQPINKARALGMNHVVLEVGVIEDALEFYGRVFEFTLRGKGKRAAFIDLGDQLTALMESRAQHPDKHRHFGLVVGDRSPVRAALETVGANILPTGSLDFRNPWGKHGQVVDYRDIQFTKLEHVLQGMGIDRLENSEDAVKQLRDKGMSR